MSTNQFILLAVLVAVCSCQRPSYAGRRPIGFPVIITTTAANRQNDTLGNKFGEGETTTTQRLPIEALGDRDLVNRLGKLPQDNQPFWFINWQALEANRRRPQTYPERPSVFLENNNNVQTPVQNSVNTQQPSLNNRANIDNQQPVQNNQSSSNIAQAAQNNRELSNTEPPVQNNQGVPQTQRPVQNNQGVPQTQRPVQNYQEFLNTQQQVDSYEDFSTYQGPVDSYEQFWTYQRPVQNNQDFSNTQQLVQNNNAFSSTQGLLQSNQNFSNTQRPR